MASNLREDSDDCGRHLADADHGAALGSTDSSDGAVIGPRGLVRAAPWANDDWALVIGTGSDLAELYAESTRLPAGLKFVQAFGDVDLVSSTARPKPNRRRTFLGRWSMRRWSTAGRSSGR